MEKQKETKNNNSRLSLYPLKFEEAVKGLLEVKPEVKGASEKERTPKNQS